MNDFDQYAFHHESLPEDADVTLGVLLDLATAAYQAGIPAHAVDPTAFEMGLNTINHLPEEHRDHYRQLATMILSRSSGSLMPS
jgi:hypothetical protein